jgi:hypothetical protein
MKPGELGYGRTHTFRERNAIPGGVDLVTGQKFVAEGDSAMVQCTRQPTCVGEYQHRQSDHVQNDTFTRRILEIAIGSTTIQKALDEPLCVARHLVGSSMYPKLEECKELITELCRLFYDQVCARRIRSHVVLRTIPPPLCSCRFRQLQRANVHMDPKPFNTPWFLLCSQIAHPCQSTGLPSKASTAQAQKRLQLVLAASHR